MFATYFQDQDIKPGFSKTFVSIFDGWLGRGNLRRLDEVTDEEFQKFNTFLRLLHQNHNLYIADCAAQTCLAIKKIEPILDSRETSLEKESSHFARIVIPELRAVYAEDWDYTWILWHMNNEAVESLAPLIDRSGLHYWHDD